MPSVDFNKPEHPSYSGYHIGNTLLFAALWGFTIVAWYSLPDQVPGHIGPGGVTRWDRRESGVWFLIPIMATINLLILYALSGIGESGASGFNTPHRKRLEAMPKDAQRFALLPTRSFMYAMASWLLILMLSIQIVMYAAARAGDVSSAAARGMIFGIIAFTGVPILLAVRLHRAIGRRIEEWERHATP